MCQRSDWTTSKIGEYCLVGDGAHAKIPRRESGVMYLTSKNFKPEGLDLSKIDFISTEDFDRHFRQGSKAVTKPELSDVLVSIIGSLGEPYVVRPSDRFGLSSSVAIIRPRRDMLVPEYLYYWMKGSTFQSAVYGTKGGVAQSYLSLEMIRSLPLRFPSLSVQRNIVDILSAFDDLIENNTRRIKILEEMAQMIYREQFVNFRFPGHERVKMVESELGLIPTGWQVCKVKEILKRLPAGAAYTEANVSDSGLHPVVDQSRKELLGYHSNAPDLNASPDCPIAIFGDHTCKMRLMIVPFSVGPNVVPFVARMNLPVAYVFFLVKDLVSTSEYKRHWTDLTNKTVVTATAQLATIFSQTITSMLELIDNLIRRNLALRQTRDLLLPKLISGEIDVEHSEPEAVAQGV